MAKLFLTVMMFVTLAQTKCTDEKKADESSSNGEVKTEAIIEATPKTDKVDMATDISESKETLVEIQTNMGNILIKLYNETPKHRDNFIKLAKNGGYETTIFHRVIGSFMIQGGDPDSKNAQPGRQYGMGGPGYTVPAEFNPKFYHKKGALAAARMGDQGNPRRESSGSQFYIVQGQKQNRATCAQVAKGMGFEYTEEQLKTYETVGGTPFLDMQYTVFGEVVTGLEIVDKIAALPTNQDRPTTDIIITKVKIMD